MTKSEQPPIVASGLALLGSQYAVALFNIGFSIVLLHLLSTTEFAVVAVLEILTSIALFSDFGLCTAFIQRAPAALRDQENRAEALGLIKLACWFRGVMLVAFGLAFILLAPQLSMLFLKSPDFSGQIRLLTCGAVAGVGLTTMQQIAQVTEDYRLIARWALVAGFSRQSVSLICFLLFGFWGYLSGVVSVICVALLGMAWQLKPYLINSAQPAPLWNTLRYGFAFQLRSFFRFGFMQFDQFIVGVLLRPEMLATYSVARRLIGYVSTITDSIQIPISIRAAAVRDESPEVRGLFAKRSMRLVLLTVLPICVGVMLASPWLMRLVGGPKYAAGWPILAVLSGVQVLYALYGGLGLQVFANREPLYCLICDCAVGLTNMTVVSGLVSMLGLYGVAWGQIVGFTVGIAVAIHFLKPFPELSLDWRVLRLLALPILVGASFIILTQWVFFSPWTAPLYYMLGGLLFVWLLAKKLSDEDLVQLKRAVPVRLHRFLDRIWWWSRSSLFSG